MNYQQKNHSSDTLSIDPLESRMMLSTVQIFASGDTGTEEFALEIDGREVQRFSADTAQQSFNYQTEEILDANRIRVRFLNDQFDAATQVDRNLRVDAIRVDGIRFETESSDVFSTGTFTDADGIVPGNGRGDVLHTNGYFQYSDSATRGSLVEVVARGSEGTEQFNLFVGNSNLRRFNASTFDRTFSLRVDQQVSADDIRIEFLNDEFDPANGIDANLIVDFVRIDNRIIQTEDPAVFSSGTFTPEDGIVPGNGRGEYLNVNGFFQFAEPGGDAGGSTLEIVARGSEGGERFNVIVDGETVDTFTAGTQDQTFTYRGSDDFAASDIQIQFINDSRDLATGFDRNLTVDLIRVDGQTFQTESATVLSTGTFVAGDGVSRGFGRGDTLHANGFFRFAAIDQTARFRVTFDATWSPETHPTEFPAGAHFSGLVGATHGDQVGFWSPGQRASAGIEEVAETGGKTQLLSEVDSAIAAGAAENALSGGGITTSPDTVTLEFDASADFSLVTLVSMIAPSPDWFVGVHDYSLIGESGWIGDSTVSLLAYDAGTDDGATFTSGDIDNTNGTITRINSGPLANNGTVDPLGTFRFERIG